MLLTGKLAPISLLLSSGLCIALELGIQSLAGLRLPTLKRLTLLKGFSTDAER